MKDTYNPTRYSQLAVARSSDDVQSRIDAFCSAVQKLRVEFGIADVHVICRMLVASEQDGGEAPVIATMHMGAVQEAEAMCAFAFARSGATRQEHVNRLKLQGIKSSGVL